MGVPLLFQVIGTAIGLGIVHVMTGPDHLSALSTLSVGKPLKTAFGLGVRWGCGHSFGLLIVAIIFFAVGRSVNLDDVAFYADLFVGIFMILLGAWYMMKAFRERMQYLKDRERKEAMELLHKQNSQSLEMEVIDHRHRNNEKEANYNMEPIVAIDDLGAGTPLFNANPDDDDDDIENNDDLKENQEIEMEQMNAISNDNDSGSIEDSKKSIDPSKSSLSDSVSPSKLPGDSEQHQLKQPRGRESYQNGHAILARSSNVTTKDNADVIPDDDIIIDGNASVNPLFDGSSDPTGRSKWMTRAAAFIAGVFHGVAGPGGVLGVMVALKLNDWFLSSLYLGLFFISSILTMGLYAILYGYCTQKLTICANNKRKCAFILKFVSAVFSLIVGVLWLSLTFSGTLNDWFE